MRPGLSPKLLKTVLRQAIFERRPSGGIDDRLAWLLAPDDPAFDAIQSDRRMSDDPTVVAHAADLDRDIAHLREGWRPQCRDLPTAPLMVVTKVAVVLSPTLVGAQLRGAVFHPDGHLISRDRMTSLVIAVDATAGTWARTLNRFYRIAFDGDQSEANEDWEDIDGGWN